MKVLIYIIIIVVSSCNLNTPIFGGHKNQPIEQDKTNKEFIGQVIYLQDSNACQWSIALTDGTELMPVQWPEEIKKKGQKIQLTFRFSRAPQPPCFKGRMIIIEDYIKLK